MWIAEVSDEVRTRIQMIYMEMPEIRLTRQQIRRLLSLPVDACEDAIRALLTSGFLAESLEGVLVRGRAPELKPSPTGSIRFLLRLGSVVDTVPSRPGSTMASGVSSGLRQKTKVEGPTTIWNSPTSALPSIGSGWSMSKCLR